MIDKVNKKCLICGKDFKDHTHNSVRKTCSLACRKELYKRNENTESKFNRKLYLRLNVFKRMGIIFSDDELIEIKRKLISGVCELCHQKTKLRYLCIDHDHKNNHYRGVICSNCNFMIGNIENSKATIENILDYLKLESSL